MASRMASRAGMDMRVTFKKTRWPGQFMARLDKIAGHPVGVLSTLDIASVYAES